MSQSELWSFVASYSHSLHQATYPLTFHPLVHQIEWQLRNWLARETRLRLGHLRIFVACCVLEVDCDEMRKGVIGDKKMAFHPHLSVPAVDLTFVNWYILKTGWHFLFLISLANPSQDILQTQKCLLWIPRKVLAPILVMWGGRTNTPLPFVISHCVWVLHFLRKMWYIIGKENGWEAVSLSEPSGLCFSEN